MTCSFFVILHYLKLGQRRSDVTQLLISSGRLMWKQFVKIVVAAGSGAILCLTLVTREAGFLYIAILSSCFVEIFSSSNVFSQTGALFLPESCMQLLQFSGSQLRPKMHVTATVRLTVTAMLVNVRFPRHYSCIAERNHRRRV